MNLELFLAVSCDCIFTQMALQNSTNKVYIAAILESSVFILHFIFP